MIADRMSIWLFESALVGFVVLMCGALAVKFSREPIKRIRLIQWTLIVAVAVPVMLRVPTYWRFDVLHWATVGSASLRLDIGEAGSLAVASTTDANDAHALERHLQAAGRDNANAFSSPRRFFSQFSLWQTGPLFLYGTAVCVLLARLWTGIASRRRVAQSCVPVSASVAALLLEIGGPRARRVRLMMSNCVHSPVTWGLWRPVIVLPLPWCQEKSAIELRYSLAHEWSHVEQRDAAACYLAVAAEMVCFYQPVFWWLRRRLALCQDLVADARAAEFAAVPEDYAAFLVTLARRQAGGTIPIALGISSRRSHLFRRISMLCSAEPITRRCSFCWNANAAVVALVALTAIAVVRIIPTSAADPPPPVTDSQDQQVPSAQTENSTPDPIVGTWKGEHGVILNLRADGTARNRWADDKININYYEYRRRDKQLVFYYSAEPDEYWRRLMQAIFGVTAERFDLVELSRTELEVIEPATGDTYVFTRTEDPVLIDSP